MPSFNIDTEEMTTFGLGNKYLFTAYFDEKHLFNPLKKYHNKDKSYFKVPGEDMEEVQQTLDHYFYKLLIADYLKSTVSPQTKKQDNKDASKKLSNEKATSKPRHLPNER